LQRRLGITFLFVTHDQEEALSLSDQIAVMNGGAVEQVGTPQELYQRPKTKFVASFLGAMNWIGKIGVRPECTRIGRQSVDGSGSRRGPAENGLQGIVTRCVYLGSAIHVEARLENGEMALAQIPGNGDSYREGETVHVWWNSNDELRFAE